MILIVWNNLSLDFFINTALLDIILNIYSFLRSFYISLIESIYNVSIPLSIECSLTNNGRGKSKISIALDLKKARLLSKCKSMYRILKYSCVYFAKRGSDIF